MHVTCIRFRIGYICVSGCVNLIVDAPELGIGLTNPCFGADPSGSQFTDDCAVD